MSSELLHADASALEAAGQNCVSSGTMAQDALTSMRNQIEGLQGSFQGAAANAFYSKMNTLFQQMQVLIDEIQEMGGDLKSTADRVRQLQAEAQTLLGD